ncbi:MAG: hypothetical protein U0031_20010 [Thermomicrobiales bacterium]
MTRAWGAAQPRRGFLGRMFTASAGFVMGRQPGRVGAEEATGQVGLPCTPCRCEGDKCDCCLIGVTGGGLLQTPGGNINLVLFATQLANDAPQEAAGFVRWLDPNLEGGITLESVGPIAYDWPEGEEHWRNVRGLMAVNGQGEEPFVLEVFDAGPDKPGEDKAKILVGDPQSATGFGYKAEGTLIGGDIQLLESVAPVATG